MNILYWMWQQFINLNLYQPSPLNNYPEVPLNRYQRRHGKEMVSEQEVANRLKIRKSEKQCLNKTF